MRPVKLPSAIENSSTSRWFVIVVVVKRIAMDSKTPSPPFSAFIKPIVLTIISSIPSVLY